MTNQAPERIFSREQSFGDRGVWVDPCPDYSQDRLNEIIARQAEQMGLQKLITPGCTVALKPNLVIKRRPDEATTTHPAVVAAVIRAVKSMGAGRVIVAESSGGLYNKTAMSVIYDCCGITEVCRAEGAELNFDFSDRLVKHPDPVICRQFNLISPIIDADVVIGIAKLKTHCMTLLSGAVKNHFGCVPGLMKPEMHCQYPEKEQFQQMLVDLITLVRPAACFVDAVDCMEGDGPSGGSKRHVGAILGGLNPFAVDVAACRLISVDPAHVIMLRHGVDRGLCPASLNEVELHGELDSLIVGDFKQPRSKGVDFLDFLPKFIRPLARKGEKLIAPRPAIRTSKCVGCGKCAESCPQHTITVKNRKASIDYSKCIRCYCCHEMCPVKAIDVKRKLIWKM